MPKRKLKVVAHLLDGKLVKGYMNADTNGDLEDLHRHRASPLPATVSIDAHAGGSANIDLHELKALFFVKSFEGRHDYKEVKFFDANPPVEGLWVQVKFADGEVTEGILHNSIRYLTDPGFYLKPPDPLSNNELVYVNKSSLREFRVLGVRSNY
jgi:hypothetical protein